MPTMFHCMQSFVRSTLHSHALTIVMKRWTRRDSMSCLMPCATWEIAGPRLDCHLPLHSFFGVEKWFQDVSSRALHWDTIAFGSFCNQASVQYYPGLYWSPVAASCGMTHTHTHTPTHTKASFHSYDSAMKLRTSPNRSRSCDDMFSVSVHGANSAFGDRWISVNIGEPWNL